MKTRLKREIYDLLKEDEISLETNLFNDYIFEMAGITLAKGQERSSGFELNGWHSGEDIYFTLPALKRSQLNKLLDFLKIDSEKEVQSTLTVDPKYVLDELMPKFKEYYQQKKQNNLSVLTKYVIESKAKLEAAAITTLRDYTQKALTTVLDGATPKMSPNAKNIVDALLLLNAKVDNLRKRPVLYKSVIESQKFVEDLLAYSEVANNAELKKQLNLILEGIALFKQYNRSESVLANQAFMKNMEEFLNQEKYKISLSQCDVAEQILLKLANAELGLKGKCHMAIGDDASRMVLNFEDINQENTEKMIQYFRKLGDETAIEGYGNSTYSGGIPESIPKSMAFDSPRVVTDMVERHSIEVDGKFFNNQVFPLLKSEIQKMEVSDPATLKKYREESKKYFEAKQSEENKPNVMSFFQLKSDSPPTTHAVAAQNLDRKDQVEREKVIGLRS